MHSAIVTAPKDDVPPGGKTWINKKHFRLISMGNTENVLNLKIYTNKMKAWELLQIIRINIFEPL